MQRPQIALALRARDIFLVFEKTYSCLFIPNCTRNMITHTNRLYPAHSLFSPVIDCYDSISRILCFSRVMDCYVSISRILCFLLLWIVTLVSRTFSFFSCTGLLRYYLAHSLFSHIMDCYVSISHILCFLL